MDRKRKNISAKVRWQVMERDGFRCIYCGAGRETATLVIDHGDPFARGGEDSIDNYVTACRECNAGKAARAVIPQAAWELDDGLGVCRNGVRYRDSLIADWAEALRHASDEVLPGVSREVSTLGGEEKSVLSTDFLCRSICGHGPQTHVVIIPLRDRGTFTAEERNRFRDGAILGYREPTMLIMGSPWHFYGVVINDRHKGCAHGFEVGGILEYCDDFYPSWYPDENWDFYDIREEHGIRPHRVHFTAWQMTASEGFNIIAKEGDHDL